MRFYRDPQIERELLDRLKKKYLTERTGTHVSTLIYCLTKGYFDMTDPLPPTDTEMILFSVGFALEEVILRDEDSPVPEPLVLAGIHMSRDYVDTIQGQGLDLKTTRMYPGTDGEPKRGWSEGWKKQFMAYALAMESAKYLGDDSVELPETFSYGVAIIYISAAELAAGTLTFTQQEVMDNWDYLLGRKEVYEAYIKADTVPTPFQWNEDWECKNCRYRMRCTALANKSKE